MLVLYFFSLFECMRLTASSKTRKEVCAYEKVCTYEKGVLNNLSLWYLYKLTKVIASINVLELCKQGNKIKSSFLHGVQRLGDYF